MMNSRLIIDNNLSFRLKRVFEGSIHVSDIGLSQATDIPASSQTELQSFHRPSAYTTTRRGRHQYACHSELRQGPDSPASLSADFQLEQSPPFPFRHWVMQERSCWLGGLHSRPFNRRSFQGKIAVIKSLAKVWFTLYASPRFEEDLEKSSCW